MAAAARGYCTVLSLPMPFIRSGMATTALSVAVATPMTIIWSDGNEDSWTPAETGGLPCVSVYDGTSQTVDATQNVWYVLLSHGYGTGLLIKEADLANAGTLVGALGGGEWAPFWRIDGGATYKISGI
jgi:hypothetical protein